MVWSLSLLVYLLNLVLDFINTGMYVIIPEACASGSSNWL